MKLTASQAVSSLPVGEKSILRWINEEAQPLFRQIRAAINFFSSERHTANSLGAGAYVRVWTSDAMPTNGVWSVKAYVVGRSTSGAVQWAVYEKYIVAGSASGTVTSLVALTNIISQESAAAIDARLVIDTTNRLVYLEARDDATSPMKWTAVVQVHEGLAA